MSMQPLSNNEQERIQSLVQLAESGELQTAKVTAFGVDINPYHKYYFSDMVYLGAFQKYILPAFVELGSTGEPLTHRDLLKHMDFGKNKSLPPSFSPILKTGVEAMFISRTEVDDSQRSEYRLTQNGLDFYNERPELYYENIQTHGCIGGLAIGASVAAVNYLGFETSPALSILGGSGFTFIGAQAVTNVSQIRHARRAFNAYNSVS